MAFQPPGTAKCSARALLPHKLDVSFVAAYSSAGRTPGSSPRIVVRTSCQGSERHEREPAYSSWSCASRAATVAAQPGYECQFTKPAAGAGLWATFHTGMGVGTNCKASPAPARSGGRRERSVANRPSVAIAYAVLPNPSFTPSPNGGPPGPGCRYAVHFLHPGPGVPPSVPA